MKCPQSYSYVSGGCYKIPVSTSYTWFDAAIACQQQGAHLATLGSIEESRWVYEYFSALGRTTSSSNSIWIGLSDIATDGDYEWLDHSSAQFRYWSDAQPDTQLGAANCVMMQQGLYGLWVSANCGGGNQALCKWNETTVPETEGNLLMYFITAI